MPAPLSNLTMTRGLPFLLAVFLSGAPVADAHADCSSELDPDALPSSGVALPYLSPAFGTPLPPDPTVLILRADRELRIEPTVDGHPAPIQSTWLADDTVLVHVETGHGRELQFDLAGRETTYPIQPSWFRTSSHVTGEIRRDFDLTGHLVDSINLVVDSDAIGFRADRADGTTFWLPAFTHVVWDPIDASCGVYVNGPQDLEVVAAGRRALVTRGRALCLAPSPSPSLYRRGDPVQLTAFHADGSREPLGLLALATAVDPDQPIGIHHLALAPLPAHGGRSPARDPRPVAVLALAAAFVTLLLVGRRRPTFTA